MQKTVVFEAAAAEEGVEGVQGLLSLDRLRARPVYVGSALRRQHVRVRHFRELPVPIRQTETPTDAPASLTGTLYKTTSLPGPGGLWPRHLEAKHKFLMFCSRCLGPAELYLLLRAQCCFLKYRFQLLLTRVIDKQRSSTSLSYHLGSRIQET